MKRSELRSLIKEELKKSLREAEGDFGGTQVSRGKIVKLPTGRFKAKNKEGDSALFSTEKEALQYAQSPTEEEWNAKFGPQSKKKNESAEDVDDDLYSWKDRYNKGLEPEPDDDDDDVKEWGPPRSPKEKTGMDYYDDSHKGSNPNRNRYDRGDDDDYDRRRDADSEDGFDDKYHRIGEITASDYYEPPKKKKSKTEVTASDMISAPKDKKPAREAITKMNGETCRWFLHCGRPATGRTPHPLFKDGVPICDRCAKFATGTSGMSLTVPGKSKPKIEASNHTQSIAHSLKPGQTIRTTSGHWCAKNMKGDVRVFKTEPEAQKFANHGANEAKTTDVLKLGQVKYTVDSYGGEVDKFWAARNLSGIVKGFNTKREAEVFAKTGRTPSSLNYLKPEAKKPSTPDEHATAIAKKTLKMPDAMANVMGGPNKKQAKDFLKKKDEELDMQGGYSRKPTKKNPEFDKPEKDREIKEKINESFRRTFNRLLKNSNE